MKPDDRRLYFANQGGSNQFQQECLIRRIISTTFFHNGNIMVSNKTPFIALTRGTDYEVIGHHSNSKAMLNHPIFSL